MPPPPPWPTSMVIRNFYRAPIPIEPKNHSSRILLPPRIFPSLKIYCSYFLSRTLFLLTKVKVLEVYYFVEPEVLSCSRGIVELYESITNNYLSILNRVTKTIKTNMKYNAQSICNTEVNRSMT